MLIDDLVKQFEGVSLTPYLDVAGIPTIGYGTTYYLDGTKVTVHDQAISMTYADALLGAHLAKDLKSVRQLINRQLSANQEMALVDFVYNLGSGALASSTLRTLINSGKFAAAAEEFLKWDHVHGKQIPGLTRRRQAERELFLK